MQYGSTDGEDGLNEPVKPERTPYLGLNSEQPRHATNRRSELADILDGSRSTR
jgi:hypothetical protein